MEFVPFPDMAAAESSQNYPSPVPPAAQRMPFYQHIQESQRQQEDRRDQDGGASEPSEPDGDQAHHEVPDDPALRSRLADVMGRFGGFGPIMQAQQANMASPSSLPPGSVAYAQASGSAGVAPPSADRNRQPRTKVSRACDECRRKKIRCDAVDETGNTPCTSCARTGTKCAFSRQPMKRGPSKGYIKELAERLNTLERQVHPPGQMQQAQQMEIERVQREMAEGLRAQGLDGQGVFDARAGDKRTHGVAEMLQSELRQPYGSSSGTPTTRGLQQPLAPAPYQPQVLAQQAHMLPFWRYGGNENRQENTGLSYEADNSTMITNFDWDEAVIDEYYRIIHQTFPLLPNSKNRLRQRLADCPTSLREAFLAALDCLMRTFPTTMLQPNANYAQALKRAAELLAKYPFDNPSSHTNATSLVYLQTLLLMALESDNHGPATIRGQAGPSRAEWLGRAAGVAGQLEINTIRTGSQSVMEGDRDSEERLARRVWWVLFILDRWHASSTADLLKLPENSVVLLPEDQILLGESTYHLARLSFIIGHLAAILTTTKTPSTDVMASSNPASSLLGLTLAGEIDRFRESVESVWGSLNLVHLSYHHCHLLIKRLNPTTEPTELVGHAVKVATVLNSRLTPVTPLNHHFGALAAMTLCELCDVPKTRGEALKGLEHMVEALGEGRGLAGKKESEGWDGAIRDLVEKKRDRMQAPESLQRLVDAATDGGAERGFDPTMLTKYGYLTELGRMK